MNLNLDYDEGIILESEDVTWVSRDDLDLDNLCSPAKIFIVHTKRVMASLRSLQRSFARSLCLI